jgi:predicted HicB family RNase H-like nuclease
MDYIEYKGYKGSVEYSKADNCLCGKVLGMSKDLIAYEGNTINELLQDFRDGVDSYISGCKADGIEPKRPYSGSLNIRITPEMHSKIASIAKDEGITINAYIRHALERDLAVK